MNEVLVSAILMIACFEGEGVGSEEVKIAGKEELPRIVEKARPLSYQTRFRYRRRRFMAGYLAVKKECGETPNSQARSRGRNSDAHVNDVAQKWYDTGSTYVLPSVL